MNIDTSAVDSDIEQVEADSTAETQAVQTTASAITQLQTDLTALEALISSQGDGGVAAAVTALQSANASIQDALTALGGAAPAATNPTAPEAAS